MDTVTICTSTAAPFSVQGVAVVTQKKTSRMTFAFRLNVFFLGGGGGRPGNPTRFVR